MSSEENAAVLLLSVLYVKPYAPNLTAFLQCLTLEILTLWMRSVLRGVLSDF